MKLPKLAARQALVAAALLMMSSGAVVSAQTLKEGEKVTEGSLPPFALNDDGRRALTEYVGNVVLLDWWGNH